VTAAFKVRKYIRLRKALERKSRRHALVPPSTIRFTLPVGQIRPSQPDPVQPACEKYSASTAAKITFIDGPSRSTRRGGSRSSRTRSGMRWTQGCARTNAQTCGRRSRVVLTPRRWRQVVTMLTHRTGDGGKKARSPGRARSSQLKPLRREGRLFRRTQR
jgi:hypothetical protein